jgi:hypothetical protein
LHRLEDSTAATVTWTDDQPRTRVVRPPEVDRQIRGKRRWLPAVVVVAIAAAIAVAVLTRHQPAHRTAAPPPAPGTHQSQPTENIAGVPVGYAHSAAGATAAATNYAVAYGSAAMFYTTQRHAIVAAIADPSVEPTLQRQLDGSFASVLPTFGLDAAGNPPAGQTFVARTVPVGVHLMGYDGNTAQVAVWCTGLIGLTGQHSVKPVAEAWSTATLTLRWTEGDWKWVDFTQTDGPTPVSGMQPASDAVAIANAVHDFGEPSYAH